LIAPASRDVARPLLAPLAHHAAVDAVLAGDEPGDLFVDDEAHPTVALLLPNNPHRVYLAGAADRVVFNQDAAALLAARAPGPRVVYHDDAAWAESVAPLFPAGKAVARQRRYLRLAEPRRGWPLPADTTLRRVDAALLAEGLAHVDELVEEIGSESPSVEAFLVGKFGFAAQHGAALVGFCLSEYNRPGRCELGVMTIDRYQRRGVATALVAAAISEARSRGIEEVGWHCWADNAPSVGLALKLGFAPAVDYPVWLCLP
jgi:GNAT superfamily N-acetyltransferase